MSLASPHFGSLRSYWLIRTTKTSVDVCHSPSYHSSQVMVPSPRLPSPKVPSPIKCAAQSFTAILSCAQPWKRQKAAPDQEVGSSLSTPAAGDTDRAVVPPVSHTEASTVQTEWHDKQCTCCSKWKNSKGSFGDRLQCRPCYNTKVMISRKISKGETLGELDPVFVPFAQQQAQKYELKTVSPHDKWQQVVGNIAC